MGHIIEFESKRNSRNSIVAESPIYKLDTQYRILDKYQSDRNFEKSIQDHDGNKYIALDGQLSEAVSEFTTSGFSGPRSKLIKTFAFGQNIYGYGCACHKPVSLMLKEIP